jgi:hypothetical protein
MLSHREWSPRLNGRVSQTGGAIAFPGHHRNEGRKRGRGEASLPEELFVPRGSTARGLQKGASGAKKSEKS